MKMLDTSSLMTYYLSATASLKLCAFKIVMNLIYSVILRKWHIAVFNVLYSVSPSEFLLPDYLSHMQEEEEENLAHFEMTEQAFDVTATSSSSSSVQTPVISQVSSTMNYDSRPSASMAQNSPGSRTGQWSEEGTAGEEAKNTIAVTSLPEPEKEEREKQGEGQNQKKALMSITIE